MKRSVLALIVLPVLAALLVTASAEQGQRGGREDVYFGFLLGTTRVAAVAVHFAAPDRSGTRAFRAYVCDGFGPPEGMAVWFTGSVAGTPTNATPQSFASVSGLEQLTIRRLNDTGAYGAFTDASGAAAHFAAYPAFDGAGIYDVTLDQNLRYTGMSTDGNTLDAQVASDGSTTGTIKLAHGKRLGFTVRNLALASPAELAEHGLPEQYTQYAADSQVPGTYVAVIAPGGTHWFGRSGFIRRGSAGNSIIGLDKAD